MGPRGDIADILMTRQTLHRPAFGAVVLVHEWGHYHWDMDDEYVEDGTPIDQNSVMGDPSSTIEFSGDYNHFTGGGQIDPDSSWSKIFSASEVNPPRPPTSSGTRFPQNRALYMDVLHQLEDLMRIEHVRNKGRTGGGTLQACAQIGQPCSENTDCDGFRTSRCDTTRDSGVCIPDDGRGLVGHSCTHNNQCENRNCVGTTATSGGTCMAPGDIWDTCETNAGCDGPRTSRCDDTRQPAMCIPDDGSGLVGDYCTHNNQCENRNCVGITATRGGTCMAAGDIEDLCETNAGCAGPRTSRCDQAVTPNRCIPNDGEGREDEYCTHNNQCNPSLGLVCRVLAGPSPQPGTCRP